MPSGCKTASLHSLHTKKLAHVAGSRLLHTQYGPGSLIFHKLYVGFHQFSSIKRIASTSSLLVPPLPPPVHELPPKRLEPGAGRTLLRAVPAAVVQSVDYATDLVSLAIFWGEREYALFAVGAGAMGLSTALVPGAHQNAMRVRAADRDERAFPIKTNCAGWQIKASRSV